MFDGSGCNSNQNLQNVVLSGGCALRYIDLGGGIQASYLKCDIVDAVTMAVLTQLSDYKKRIDRSVEAELTKIMEGLICGVGVDE